MSRARGSRKRGSAHTPGDKVFEQERRRQVLMLRKTGATFDQIARTVSPPYADASGAYRAYKTAMRELIKEPGEEVKLIELARLDELLFAVWPKAIDGDPKSVEAALRIMRRRASYLGLDAPERRVVEVLTDESIDRAYRELTEQMTELDEIRARTGMDAE